MDKRTLKRVNKYLTSGAARATKLAARKIAEQMPDEEREALSKRHG